MGTTEQTTARGPLPHEEVMGDDTGFDGLTRLDALAADFAEAFRATVDHAERQCDGVVLERWYVRIHQLRAAVRTVEGDGRGPLGDAWSHFRDAAEELASQRTRSAGIAGFEAGYAAALAALGVDAPTEQDASAA